VRWSTIGAATGATFSAGSWENAEGVAPIKLIRYEKTIYDDLVSIPVAAALVIVPVTVANPVICGATAPV